LNDCPSAQGTTTGSAADGKRVFVAARIRVMRKIVAFLTHADHRFVRVVRQSAWKNVNKRWDPSSVFDPRKTEEIPKMSCRTPGWPLGLLIAPILLSAGSAWAGFEHAPLDALLRRHVERGRVDYDAIKRSDRDRAKLEAYVRSLAKAKVDTLDKQQQLAFYLNAYNALVLRAVVRRRPKLKRVMDVEGFFKQHTYRVAGRELTLDQLENKLIRPRFRDPRIHFALVCAARSCPPLQERAFRGATLERTLERLTRAFINSPRGVRLGQGKPRISKIFDWYAADFRAAAGSVGKYLARYHARGAASLGATRTFAFLPYDWALNIK
jgi:hypothetical protein